MSQALSDPAVAAQVLNKLADANALGDTEQTKLRQKIGLRGLLTLANAAARKNPASYVDDDTLSVGYTRVIQADLPGVIWVAIAADVSLDASWHSQVNTNLSAPQPDGFGYIPNEDGGLDLTMWDIGTETYRRVRLENGNIVTIE